MDGADSAACIQRILRGALDSLSSHEPARMRDGRRSIEALLAELCLGGRPGLDEFCRLQDGFELNGMLCAAGRLTGQWRHSWLRVSGGCLMVLGLLGPDAAAEVQIAALGTLVAALVDRWDNVRVFESLDGLAAVAALMKSRDSSQKVKLKIAEFLYFYLVPEPVFAGPATNRALDIRRSTEEKEALLARYLHNVRSLVRDLQELTPFGRLGLRRRVSVCLEEVADVVLGDDAALLGIRPEKPAESILHVVVRNDALDCLDARERVERAEAGIEEAVCCTVSVAAQETGVHEVFGTAGETLVAAAQRESEVGREEEREVAVGGRRQGLPDKQVVVARGRVQAYAVVVEPVLAQEALEHCVLGGERVVLGITPGGLWGVGVGGEEPAEPALEVVVVLVVGVDRRVLVADPADLGSESVGAAVAAEVAFAEELDEFVFWRVRRGGGRGRGTSVALDAAGVADGAAVEVFFSRKTGSAEIEGLAEAAVVCAVVEGVWEGLSGLFFSVGGQQGLGLAEGKGSRHTAGTAPRCSRAGLFQSLLGSRGRHLSVFLFLTWRHSILRRWVSTCIEKRDVGQRRRSSVWLGGSRMPSKRTRNDSDVPVPDEGTMSALPSSLPPSSPPMLSGLDISENEALIDDMIDDLDEAAEEEDGEDLFGEDMER
ncbi:hypothetical protein PMAC_001853 [Pneumocystis sp. 'macacae']|nr:hypothetical protein PMAC_001853 [Pneumocystis sp. 'macacae']